MHVEQVRTLRFRCGIGYLCWSGLASIVQSLTTNVAFRGLSFWLTMLCVVKHICLSRRISLKMADTWLTHHMNPIWPKFNQPVGKLQMHKPVHSKKWLDSWKHCVKLRLFLSIQNIDIDRVLLYMHLDSQKRWQELQGDLSSHCLRQPCKLWNALLIRIIKTTRYIILFRYLQFNRWFLHHTCKSLMPRPDTWKLMVFVRQIRRDDNLRRYDFSVDFVIIACFTLYFVEFCVQMHTFTSSHTRHQSKGCWGSGKTNSPRIAAAIYSDLSRGHPKWWFSEGILPKKALNQVKDFIFVFAQIPCAPPCAVLPFLC